MLFPHATIRPSQDELIKTVIQCVENKTNLIVHAPTGLGKTAATLAPALAYASARDLSVIFLTSRHTQHKIVLDTIRLLRDRHLLRTLVTSLIGKQHLCSQPNSNSLHTRDFHAFCKTLRENAQCTFYENMKSKIMTENLLGTLKKTGPHAAEDVHSQSTEAELCPYEISLLLASESKVIVTDYYYLLSKPVRDSFLRKSGKQLEKCIIIVDEAHNLPSRCRELLTSKLSVLTVLRAIKEAKQHYEEIIPALNALSSAIADAGKNLSNGKECKVSVDALVNAVSVVANYDDLIVTLTAISEIVREQKQHSGIGSVAEFLVAWKGPEEGFVRYATMQHGVTQILRTCLDPSLAMRDVVQSAYCTILMSGTLQPTSMYAELLQFPSNTAQRSLQSPFNSRNRLVLIVPITTTQYSQRSNAQFARIASTVADIVNSTPGHSAVFFPSYAIRDAVFAALSIACKKTVFCEQSNMSKSEKQSLLDRFVKYGSAVLLAVAGGSFGEGIDLPGILKSVIVVGLPLEPPTLETQELIKYYDAKFGKGWDYGYTLPAFTKCLQNAGRCIRSETDHGVICFLDERYAWPKYKNCIPSDWNATITKDYKTHMNAFFATHNEHKKSREINT